MHLLNMFKTLIAALSVPVLATFAHPPGIPHSPGDFHPSGGHHYGEKTCVVEPRGTNDSAPAIIDAFHRCGHNAGDKRGRVVFNNETYHIKSVMNTTGLSNVDIDHHGTLLWDTNIPYWLHHSLPVGYQNQSSAWLFGGENVRWSGYGYGTLDGNGQVGFNGTVL